MSIDNNKYKFLNVGNLLRLVLFTVMFLLLYLGFQSNHFELSDERQFQIFAQGTDAFVINRIAVSDKLGPQAYNGFVGRVPDMDIGRAKGKGIRRGKSQLDVYYKQFYNIVNQNNFKPYYSNLAIQSQFLSYLKRKSILSPGVNFNHYRSIFSFIGAITFLLFLIFLEKEFGWIPSFVAFIAIVQSDWLMASGAHFFWFSAFMFLPFVLNFFILKRYHYQLTKCLIILFVINTILCLMKSLISGFEVIPTFLVLTTLPVFYAFLSYRIKIISAIMLFCGVSMAALSGTGLGIVYQAKQISILEGKPDAGMKHFKNSFFRRSSGKGRIRPNMPERIKQSYRVSSLDVINKYWKTVQYTRGDLRNKKAFLRSDQIFYTLCFFTIIAFIVSIRKVTRFLSSQFWGLLLMTWVSLIGPLSMFVVFKSLSWIHPHLVPVTWMMPFCILVSIVVAVFFSDLFRKISFYKSPE